VVGAQNSVRSREKGGRVKNKANSGITFKEKRDGILVGSLSGGRESKGGRWAQ